MSKYTIGIDFGTQSGRVVLVSVDDGQEMVSHVTTYKHGVMSESLPNRATVLPDEWALQHPQDYMDVIENSIPAVLQMSGVSRHDVIGIGVDFTACTILPVDENLTPLCLQEDWSTNPHSWVKLWKHHAAQHEANLLNEIAEQENERFLQRYGGKISSEWMIPKLWQIVNEAPEVYAQADQFIEAGDWIIAQLTGNLMRNSCAAGYKGLWHKKDGYLRKDFLKKLDVRLEDLVETKLRGNVYAPGTVAGTLKEPLAEKLGLNPTVAVSTSIIDAHVAVPAVGVFEAGKMVMSMGTSTCHMILSTEEKFVPGISGVVEDGIIPGLYGYEAGQAAVGDIFEWFIKQCVPMSYHEEAMKQQFTIYQYLEQLAAKYKPGEIGLLALDWWNGNRSTLVDADLTGMIIGLSLRTKPEEIYRALLEATAFGTKKIIDTFVENGVAVEEIYACGGLAKKNKLLMQIYADVTNLSINIADSYHTTAVGSAMLAAVAAGAKQGGYETIEIAAKKMARVQEETIQPVQEHAEIYDELYAEYIKLHNYFGKGENNIMKHLKKYKLHYNE